MAALVLSTANLRDGPGRLHLDKHQIFADLLISLPPTLFHDEADRRRLDTGFLITVFDRGCSVYPDGSQGPGRCARGNGQRIFNRQPSKRPKHRGNESATAVWLS